MSNIKQSEIVKLADEAVNKPGAQTPEIQAAPMDQLVTEKHREKTQAELDREATLIKLETETLALEMKKLELEKLKKDVADIRRQQEAERMSQETVQSALKYNDQRQIQHETLCTHMKGGQSETMLGNAPSQGNDSANYCVIDHTLSTGVRFRMCQRCGKTWFPKDPDYREAMAWPTRNSASVAAGGHGLVQDWSKVQVKSYLPHKPRPTTNYGDFE